MHELVSSSTVMLGQHSGANKADMLLQHTACTGHSASRANTDTPPGLHQVEQSVWLCVHRQAAPHGCSVSAR